jgi:hypothetical protein
MTTSSMDSLLLSKDLQGKALLHLFDALSCLHPEERAAFEEARQVCPGLVEKESNPALFLSANDFHSIAAACKIAAYWKQRKEFLGNEAFFPLTPGSEALIELPDTDEASRRVFYYRVRQVIDMRSFFFQLSTSNAKGSGEIVLLAHVTPESSFPFDQRLQNFLSSALPWTLHAVHVVWLSSQPLQMPKDPPLKPFLAKRTTLHSVATVNELVIRLEAHGMRKSGIPADLGGSLPMSLDDGPSDRKPSPVEASHPHSSGSVGENSDHSVPFTETLEMQLGGLRRLQEAIAVLPPEDSAAYIAAIRLVPHLVQKESDPIRFLRCEAYNAWSAARKLALHWKMRVDIFGNRAFRPMTLNNGAMDHEAVHAFRSGYCSFLPSDDQGRMVVAYDAAKKPTMSEEVRLRCAFYALAVISEHELSPTKGFIIILILGAQFDRHRLDDFFTRAKIKNIVDSFPTTVEKIHLVKEPVGIGERLFFEGLLPLAMRCHAPLVESTSHIAVHVGDKRDLMLKLGEFGIKGLPDAIGGPYSVKEHLAWMQERFLIEGGRYKELAMPATHMNALMRAPVPAASHNSTFVPEQNENINLVQVAAATEHAINFGLQEFAQALDQIPHGAKASYMQAMQQAPELVERESNPAAFLRREAFDAAAAARRLVKYWEVRVTIFEEKAFMPLNQTGTGHV